MVNLHYSNLPDVEYPIDWLVKPVNFALEEYLHYITIAKDLLWNPARLEVVRWKPATKDLPDKEDDSIGFWVEVEEVGERDDVDVIDDFANAEIVIDAPDPKAPWNRVLDADANRGLLCLEREPRIPKPQTDGENPEHLLYIRPNDHVLKQQQRALWKLRDRPEREHRGIIRLLEDSRNVRWPDVTPGEPESWEFLKDGSIEGTDEQRRFVEVALGTPDFAILEGPPGSGKTTTICELIIQEIRRGHRILLCASTHVAVDNVLEFLQDRGVTSKDVLAVRIGDEHRISDQVREFQLSRRAAKEARDLIERLGGLPSRTKAQQYLFEALQSAPDLGRSIVSRTVLESANLVCGTTIGILQHPDIKAQREGKKDESGEQTRKTVESVVRLFDCLIVDEASKTTFQELLVPALFARKWVLVGDVNQLSPYVDATQIEDNLRGMIDEEDDATVCLNVFQAWPGSHHSTQGIVVFDPLDPSKYIQQAEKLGLGVVDLTQDGQAISPIEILGSHVVLCKKGLLPRIQGLIPADAMVYPADAVTPEMRRRHDYWSYHHPGEPNYLTSEDMVSEWANSVAWRIGRSFEHRNDEAQTKIDDQAVYGLLPQWYGEESIQQMVPTIKTIKRIALPSALELIQNGFGRRADSLSGSSLTDGMDETVFQRRHVKLSYQHRMHPDISRFPREFVYDSDSLKDTRNMAKDRDWSYGRFTKRTGWIQPVRGWSDSRFRNRVEADIVQLELQTFLGWASVNRKRREGFGNVPWEVAVLTFYRGQESLLRARLQRMFGTRARTEFWTPDRAAKIRLGTVDRFQGHEADLVIISFARSRGIGFLDSPNRLNVAVTRARYQLLLVGNRGYFMNHWKDTLLKKLAMEVPRLRVAWEEAR